MPCWSEGQRVGHGVVSFDSVVDLDTLAPERIRPLKRAEYDRHPVFESVDTFTVAEFDAWVREQEQRGETSRYELLSGRIVMVPPAGWPHGGIEGNLVGELQAFVRPRGLGRVFGSRQGFRLPSDDVVEPDVSFVSNERWAARPIEVYAHVVRVVGTQPDAVELK